MGLIDQAFNWVHGEMFESKIMFIFGLLGVFCAFLFWKFGTTINAKSLVWPLLIFGLVLSVSGVSMYASNAKRLETFTFEHQVSSEKFLDSEIKRVEDFQYMYVYTKWMAVIFFSFCVFSFAFTKNSTLQSIGVALALFAISGLVIDLFSEERAKNYYEVLLEIQKNSPKK